MNEHLAPEFTVRLAMATRELRNQSPPATLLPAIHRAVARRATPGTTAERKRAWMGWASVVAACAALVVVLAVSPAGRVAADTQGFLAVAGQDAWLAAAQSDSGSVWLVPAEITQGRLAALGLPYDPANAGELIPAQLLMHGWGGVLAVRVNQ
jgi:hypothetical protein